MSIRIQERFKRVVAQAGQKALEACALLAERYVKETLGVHAIQVRVRGNGSFSHQSGKAKPPPTPPRLVSGNLYRSVKGSVVGGKVVVTASAKSKKGFPYGLYHEVKNFRGFKGSGRRPFILPTFLKRKYDLRREMRTVFANEMLKLRSGLGV